jgi:hypothetical protein
MRFPVVVEYDNGEKVTYHALEDLEDNVICTMGCGVWPDRITDADNKNYCCQWSVDFIEYLWG